MLSGAAAVKAEKDYLRKRPLFVAFLHLKAMLKKENRLKNNEEFRLVYRGGKFAVSHSVVVYYRKTSDSSALRAGFVVSKKIGGSHIRSRHKRLLREAFRQVIPRVKTGYDLVFVARRAIVGKDFSSVVTTLENLLCKARLLTGRRVE